MNFVFNITVHVHIEDRLDDQVLVLHSNNYGIVGKEIIEPLRKMNGNEYCINDVQEDFTVQDLWDWIDIKLYGNSSKSENGNIFDLVREGDIVKKYLVFNELRYAIKDTKKPLVNYLSRMGISEKEIINIQLLVSSDAGELFNDDGIRYYMNSKEYGKHNIPHVHVDIRHKTSGTFSIIDGSRLSGKGIKKSDEKKIEEKIMSNRKDLIEYWNLHTDGLTVDLNQALRTIAY